MRMYKRAIQAATAATTATATAVGTGAGVLLECTAWPQTIDGRFAERTDREGF